MVYPVVSSLYSSQSPSFRKPQFGESSSAEPVKSDKVDLSKELRQKVVSTQPKASEPVVELWDKKPTWEMVGDVKTGSFQLENGNTQVVRIEDDELEILEYEQGQLVKSVKGTLFAHGATLDTERYDSSGKVIQTIHSEVNRSQDKRGVSFAELNRQVKWFEHGKLTGEMQDSMLLATRTTYNGVLEGVAGGMKKAVKQAMAPVADDVAQASHLLSNETHYSNYYARVLQYDENETLRRSVVLENNGEFNFYNTNRSEHELKGVPARSTQEGVHKTDLSVTIQDFDADGNVIRDASFYDDQIASPTSTKGKQEQTIDVKWYHQGELVKKSHGSMTLMETPAQKLQDRPGFKEIFGLSDEEYLGEGPQSAMGMMSKNFMRSSSEADHFMKSLGKHVGKGHYDEAQTESSLMRSNQPYSIMWSDELYKNGELTVRQEDSESSELLMAYKRVQGQRFMVGHGLTEDARPHVLRKHSHKLETFEKGELVSSRAVESREGLKETAHNPDALVTETSVREQGAAGSTFTMTKAYGGIGENAAMLNSGAKGFGNAVRLTLADFGESVRSLDVEQEGTASDHHVALHMETLPYPCRVD